MSGTGTLLSRFLVVQGLASVVGEFSIFRVPGWRDLQFFVLASRFFETTGLAALTTLIQHYKVELHPEFAEELCEQLKEMYSQATSALTLK